MYNKTLKITYVNSVQNVTLPDVVYFNYTSSSSYDMLEITQELESLTTENNMFSIYQSYIKDKQIKNIKLYLDDKEIINMNLSNYDSSYKMLTSKKNNGTIIYLYQIYFINEV